MTLITPTGKQKLIIEIDNECDHSAVFVGYGDNIKIITIEELMKILPSNFLNYKISKL